MNVSFVKTVKNFGVSCGRDVSGFQKQLSTNEDIFLFYVPLTVYHNRFLFK